MDTITLPYILQDPY